MDASISIQQEIQPYVSLDEPIPYKDIYLHPVLVKDIYRFMGACDILTLPKNKTGDISIIQMSYLQFIVQLMIMDKIWREKFIEMASLCFRVDKGEDFIIEDFPEEEILRQDIGNGASVLYINGWNIRFFINEIGSYFLDINDHRINAQDFNKVRKMIMYQNIIDFDDEEEMSEDFRRLRDEFYGLKNKGKKPITLEDKITAIMSQGSLTKEQIKTMTYRTMEQVFIKVISHTEYVIGKMSEMQGCTKEPTEHWVYKLDKDKYAEMFSSPEAFKDKIQRANG